MAPANPTSFRLSDEALRMVRELEERMGIKRTAVLETAIRALYRKEVPKAEPKPKGGRP